LNTLRLIINTISNDLLAAAKSLNKEMNFYLAYVYCLLSGFSQSEGKRIDQFNLDRKVAIQGYVAYFKQGKALKGKGFDFNI
jgi:hypothetical protein